MERSTFCSSSNDGKYSSASLNLKNKMIVLRKSFSEKHNEDPKSSKIDWAIPKAVGLTGTGGYLVGTSGKKMTDKKINKRLNRLDSKLKKTKEDYKKGLKEIEEWKNLRLQREDEIASRKLRSIDKESGIFKGYRKSAIKKLSNKRKAFIENKLAKQKEDKLASTLAQKRVKLKELKLATANKMKKQAQIKRGIGGMALAAGLGLGAAAGYNYYTKNHK